MAKQSTLLKFFYDAPGFTEITGIIDARIVIPSPVDGVSNFSATFDNYRGRIFDDIFDHAGAQIGLSLKCKFQKDDTDLYYGRIWGINPLINESGDKITITGQGFDRELAIRKLVETEDVRAALNFVARGECQVGIVYATDAAISKDVKVAGIFPENTHSPIIYPLGLIKKNSNSAKFYQFLQSNQAKAVFKKYGFSMLAPVKL